MNQTQTTRRASTAAALFCAVVLVAPGFSSPAAADERPRVIVLTDISNEPDDEESMVRFLVYANELDVEGLIATTSTHLRDRTREDLIRRQLAAYGAVRDNLAKHAPGYPTREELEAGTYAGAVTLGESHGPQTSLRAPAVEKPETVHVILQLEDQGEPALFAYRRAIVTVTP